MQQFMNYWADSFFNNAQNNTATASVHCKNFSDAYY